MRLNQVFEPRPAVAARTERWLKRVAALSERHPVLAIVAVSLLAVAINCYPIIFCGKSYLSPAKGLPVVYDSGPPLPGMANEPTVNDHGSDSAATLLWGVPAGFLESRSFWEHGEIPLWNRYSHSGDTLIGQALSMLGDPLHVIVILGHGSVSAWDFKFLVAKFLFCVGFGLLILRLLGSLPLALVFSVLAAYCGAFFFIDNHFSYFVFSYAPWILLSAVTFLDTDSKRCVRWGLVWLVANCGCFNAGHVELAVVLIVALNLAALVFALLRNRGFKVLVRMAVATLLFLGLTCPVWLAFFAALPGAYSLHSQIGVNQLPFVTLVGMFDDVFLRLPLKSDSYAAVAPGNSFLIAVGCILSFIRWRSLRDELFFWINLAAIVVWGGCVFGWVPASILSHIPLFNRIGHTYTELSFLLVMHLTIQCAYGFKSVAKENKPGRIVTHFAWTGALLAGMISLFCFGITHRPVPWSYFACVTAGAFGAPMLYVILKSRVAAIPFYGWAGILVLGFLPHFRFGLYNFGDPNFLLLPGPRVALDAPSPAIEAIKTDSSAPFRTVGLNRILYGDYAAVYGLEDIRSCAPLSNGELMDLIRNFPGVKAHADWVIEVVDPVAARPLLNLLNVKYLLTPSNIALQSGLGFRLAERSDLGVLENLNVWPRAFFSDAVIPIASGDAFIAYLLQHGGQPFVALAPEEIGKNSGIKELRAAPEGAISPATNYLLLPNSTSFDIHANSAGVVCLAEGQSRYFTATANGHPEIVLTVNRAFKGIYLAAPGDYHITFTYRPGHWRPACGLFATALCVVFVLAVSAFCRGPSKKEDRMPNLTLPR